MFRCCIALLLTASLCSSATYDITTQEVGNGFSLPVAVAAAPGVNSKLFVVEKETGRIRILDPVTKTIATTPFVTVGSLKIANEQGVLGLAFHPNYASNGFLYVTCTRLNGNVEILRFHADGSPTNPTTASGETLILSYPQPNSTHNGGWLGFGPDGMLYIATGDGGNGWGGQNVTSQNLTLLLGKILRLDVNAAAPYIPANNPYATHPTFHKEIWCFGLRNPWRCSFDRATGDLWIGDVGQSNREEISLCPAGQNNLNFGWPAWEGTQPYVPAGFSSPPPLAPGSTHTLPIVDFTRSQSTTIVGGHVYRGAAIPTLVGSYVGGNYQASVAQFHALQYNTTTRVLSGPDNISAKLPVGGSSTCSFGEDNAGELYIVAYLTGKVFKIVPAGVSITSGPTLSPTTIGRPYSLTLAAAGGTAPYAWTVTAGALPSGVTLASTGVLSGTPTVSGSFTVTVQATAIAGGSTSKALALTVNAAPLVTTASPLNAATQNSSYAIALSNSGGTPAFTWSLTAGTLPSSITLASNGLLSGTPTATGTTTFTAQVTDAVGATANKAFALTVNAGVLAPTITTVPTLPDQRLRIGGAYTFDIDATGVPAPTFSLTSAPSGMTINPTSGVITWTAANTVGNSTVTVQAANGTLPNATLTYAIDVHDHGLSVRPAVNTLLGPTSGAGNMPANLSGTGIFSDTASFTLSPAMIPFGVNTPLWSDHAIKTRWLSVPTGQTIAFAPTGSWTFPGGTVFVKHFSMDLDEANPGTNVRRLETRVLVTQQSGGVFGVTYKWNGSDAVRLDTQQTEVLTIQKAGGGSRTQTWLYPSPADCLQCHTPASGFVLGVNTRQLNGNYGYPAGSDNQLRTLSYAGLFASSLSDASIATYPKLSALSDTAATLEQRARSYLDANCAQCHRPGGGTANFDARYDTTIASQGLINGFVNNTLDIGSGAVVIAPGDLSHSVLLRRISASVSGPDAGIRMPPLARDTVDDEAIAVFTAWINTMPNPGTLALSAAAFSQVEGNSGNTLATIMATRSGGTAGAVSVNYATANGTATSGTDFSAASGVLSWADGDSAAKPITITITGDTTNESDETVFVTLSGATGNAAIGLATATLTISNDDAAPTTTTVTLQSGVNGYAGMIDSYISSSSPTNTAGGVGVGLTETYNASSGTDSRTALVRFPIFAAEGGPVPNGATIVSASLSLYQYSTATLNLGAHRLLHTWVETANSWNESAAGVPWLSAGANASGGDYVGLADGMATTPTAAGWVNLDVTSGVQAFAGGTTNYGWRLRGSGALTGQSSFRSREYTTDITQRPKLTIVYATGAANSAPVITQVATASPNAALIGSSIALSVAASDANNDPLSYAWNFGDGQNGTGSAISHAYAAAGSYTATATVSDGKGGNASSSVVVTIVNPPVGTVAFSATTSSVAEGNSGTTLATFTVNRTGGSFGAVSVSYATADGTAQSGADYSATSGTLAWADGDATSKSITVSVTGDTAYEPDETVLLTLSAPTGGATLGAASATLTLTNDDVATATTVTLQNGLNGYIGTLDNYVSSGSPTNTNGGTLQNVTATQDALGNDSRVVLVKFPIFAAEGGPVPDGAIIQSATLSLYQYSAVAHNFAAYRVLKGWNESATSWNNATLAAPWSAGGASGLGSDITTSADGSGATTAAAGWLNLDVTAGVSAFALGAANYGWRLKGVGATSGSENFRSREYTTDPTQRPKLIIIYQIPPAAPSASG